MKYGFFDDHAKEYLINTPYTPYPWINYLGTQDFYALISNTSGGYCFYKDARFRRITRYRYNNVPLDEGGFYIYIKDGNKVWSPAYKPAKETLDSYECRHGLGYTKFSSRYNGIQASSLYFVPVDIPVLLNQLTLTNHSDTPKSLQVFSMTEFCLWNALDDMTNFQRNLSIGEVEVEGSTIYHKTEYRERRNHYSFFSVNHNIDGFDTERDEFVGMHNGFDRPKSVINGQCSNSIAQGWAIVGAHQINVSLNPGESIDLIFSLGYAENPDNNKFQSDNIINKEPAHQILNLIDTTKKVDIEFQKLRLYWEKLLNNYTLQHPDPKLSRMVNIWNQYQVMVTFLMSRSASYFESGIGRGMGFRDSSQDILGFVHQAPERARERLIDLAATQREDGSAYHQYQPLTKRGNDEIGSGFNDDPLWLIYAVCAYIRESGDYTILEEQIAFDNNPNNSAPMLEHLKRGFDITVNSIGPNGLPLIGRADWNDCLNLNCFSTTPDESFQTYKGKDGKNAESVLIACMAVYIGKDYHKLLINYGHTHEADKVNKQIKEIESAVITNGWDGEWYLRAYDDASSPIGSHTNTEGKIFIETQGFGAMAQIGTEQDFPRRALDSAWKHLDTQYGMMILSPGYTKYLPNLGEITSYPPGYKENAGIFCHNNPWIMIGETILGRGDKAFECYRKICPAYLEDISELHKTEPYVYSQMIAGKEAANHGQAKNSWLTGTASWNLVAITQHILGIRPDYKGLIVDPCIPSDWEGFKVRRKFRNAEYLITVRNPNKLSKGVHSILIDGQKIEGNIIPDLGDNKTHYIEVTLT